MGTDRKMTTWNYYNWCGQVRETDTGLLVADITMRPNDEEIGTLAAAAPELLEALEALLVHLEDTGVDLNDCEDECRAAIAKATGGEVGS
jgi:hypothetical protein